jgi:hypothetical protein
MSIAHGRRSITSPRSWRRIAEGERRRVTPEHNLICSIKYVMEVIEFTGSLGRIRTADQWINSGIWPLLSPGGRRRALASRHRRARVGRAGTRRIRRRGLLRVSGRQGGGARGGRICAI